MDMHEVRKWIAKNAENPVRVQELSDRVLAMFPTVKKITVVRLIMDMLAKGEL